MDIYEIAVMRAEDSFVEIWKCVVRRNGSETATTIAASRATVQLGKIKREVEVKRNINRPKEHKKEL